MAINKTMALVSDTGSAASDRITPNPVIKGRGLVNRAAAIKGTSQNLSLRIANRRFAGNLRGFDRCPKNTVREIVFIDPAVDDIDTLIASLRPEVAVQLLDAAASAPAQIARALTGFHDLDAIHVLAHGGPGEVCFAAGTVSLDTIGMHRASFAAIGRALLDDGALLLWSCETGKGSSGERFVEALERLSGAWVTAARFVIGNAERGGTWDLDAADLPRSPLTDLGREQYLGTLAINYSGTPVITSIAGDNIVNGAEATGSFSVNGTETYNGSNPNVGDIISITLTFTDNSSHSQTYSNLNAQITAVNISTKTITWNANILNLAALSILESGSDHLTATINGHIRAK